MTNNTLPPLTDAELVHAKKMKQEWLAQFGNDEFIRECVKAGLIDGWRNVESVKPLEETDEHH